MAISDQNSRMRPLERRTSGINEAAPETNKKHWTISLTAVSPKDRGRTRAATINAVNEHATAASQRWENLPKTLLRPHSRSGRGAALITEVTDRKKLPQGLRQYPSATCR